MIALAVRLTITSGRAAAARLTTVGAAVAVGVILLLSALAGLHAVQAQNARYAWLAVAATGAPAESSADPLWARLRKDVHRDEVILRVDVAATGPTAPVPPGMTRLPGAGEYLVSPALADLIDSNPDDELRDRFPGQRVGLLTDAALPGPQALLAVVGRPVEDVAGREDAVQVTSITTVSPDECDNCALAVGVDADGIRLVLSVVAVAILLPVAVFIAAATRLSAARREQRLAALRLAGATGRQVAVVSVVESAAAALVGTLSGVGLFYLLRPLVARIPYTGEPFFPADVHPDAWALVAVVAGTPMVAAALALVALRRVTVSPLGVARRTTPAPPRTRRLIPLAAGVIELAVIALVVQPSTSTGQVLSYIPGFVLVMVGLLLAGPWLTAAGAHVLVRRAQSPATLMAGRRLADDPHGAFRAVGGVVLALFVTSVAVGVMTTFIDSRSEPPAGQSLDNTVIQQAEFGTGPGLQVDEALPSVLLDTAGVTGAVVFHRASGVDVAQQYVGLNALAACSQLRTAPELGRCPEGAAVVRIDAFLDTTRRDSSTRVWPASDVAAQALTEFPVQSVAVGTDGAISTVERVRTVLEAATDDASTPYTPDEFQRAVAADLARYQQLATVVVVTSLPIAGCSLAVALLGGLAERRRPFSLLRLSGVPARLLRRVVVLESVTPLAAGSLLALGAGLLGAHLYTRSQLDTGLTPPGPAYWALVCAGLAAALLLIASTLPLVARTTGPEAARND